MNKKLREKRAELREEIKKIEESRADKHDSGKARVELVHPVLLVDVALVLEHGAKKYGDWNWTKGLPWMRIYASTLRHLLSWALGEDLDGESGLPHLSHAAANIMFLMVWSRTHPELDDRIKI